MEIENLIEMLQNLDVKEQDYLDQISELVKENKQLKKDNSDLMNKLIELSNQLQEIHKKDRR